MIRVLVVDDSAFMRKVVSDILNEAQDIEVVGTARDGVDALEKIESLRPDVVTLDVEMPRMTGLEVMRALMQKSPSQAVVMLSTATQRGSAATMEALSLGAVDFVPKPSGAVSLDLEKVSDLLVRKVRTAAGARIPARRYQKVAVPVTAAVSTRRETGPSRSGRAERLVVIGASTGGPRALEVLFQQLPSLPAGVLVVQHMPAGFTGSLARRLDSISPMPVREAEHDEVISNRKVLVAPGNYHMIVRGDKVALTQDAPVNFVRPAIDLTMTSAVEAFGRRIVGVILTGMGRDGAQGMAAIKDAGGMTIVQNRETATIPSMPQAVMSEGNADVVLPLEEIANKIHDMVVRV